MKRLALAFCVLATFALSACTTFLEPTCAERGDILVDVYNKTFDIMMEDGLEDYSGQLYNTLRFLRGDGGFSKISQSEKISNTEMLEWCLNESMQGNSYTGYYITYEVRFEKSQWYALVDLTEFDSGRYEWKVIYASESLSEIQGMLY